LTARPEQFVQTLTEKMMTYALGRGIEYYDMPTIRAIVRDTGTAQDPRERYKFSAIVMRIVTSDAFQESRIPSTVAKPLTAQAGSPQ